LTISVEYVTTTYVSLLCCTDCKPQPSTSALSDNQTRTLSLGIAKYMKKWTRPARQTDTSM